MQLLTVVAPSFMQTVKMGVQYSLWGGSVMNLGTERHKKQYFDAIDKFQIPGQPKPVVMSWLKLSREHSELQLKQSYIFEVTRILCCFASCLHLHPVCLPVAVMYTLLCLRQTLGISYACLSTQAASA